MNEAARIVDGLRDGLMDAAGQQVVARRLATDAELRTAVRDEWRLQRRLAGLLADDDATALWNRISDGLRVGSSVSGAQRTFAAVERRLDARRHRRRRMLRRTWWPMAAALVAAAVLVAVLLIGHEAPGTRVVPALRVATVQGDVQVEGADGLRAARSGMVLSAADRIGTAAGAAAGLELADGSRLDLAGGSLLGWEGEARFRLERGTVAVAARPRAVVQALAIATPRAVAIVVGTRFRLSHQDDRTVLRVSEGTVRFAPVDAAPILVHAIGEAASPAVAAAVAAAAKPASAPAPAATTGAIKPPPATGSPVVAFCLVDAESGMPLPGWEHLTADATLDLRTLPARGWTVLALTAPDRLPAVAFRIDGMAAGQPQNAPPYALTASRSADGTNRFHPWRPAPGIYRIEAIPCRSRTDATPTGRGFAITLTITGEPR